jgi:tyrosine-protein kinase Etk/Wzc
MKQKMLETKFDIEALKSKRDALNATIQTYDRRFRAIPRQSLEFARLQRERLSNEKLYTMVEEKYNETAISEKSEFGYVDVIDRAIVPGAPTGPNATRNLLMGLLLGLGLGVGIVVMRDVLDVRVRTPEQLKRRGYPPLSEVATMQGELSQLEKSGKVPREVRRFDKRLWLIFNPLSFLAESYRRLRTNLLRVQIERPLQALLVTSPNPGEGKSTTIANLAVAFAESNRRVLLIDADLRRPTVHTAFGLPVRPGLTDVLQKKATFEEAVQRSVVENLDVLCCGTISRNPSRFFGSVEMRELVEHARKNYGWVLIDAPPILVVNDGAVLSALVDGTILTLAAGLTRFAALERASEFLESAGGHFLGVVLNMFDARKAYGSYYGGTRYGHYDKNNGYYSGVPGDSSTWTPSQTN